MPELITICMPTYRRPSLLLHAIHSCLLQDHRPLEIDIGDDSRSPDTENLVRSFVLPPDVTLRYWRNSPSLGQHGNVNKLFALARGSKLVLLHDDDALLPGAIAELDRAFSLSDSVIASYGMQHVIAENGESSPTDSVSHNNHSNRTPAFTGLQRDVVKCALWRQFPNNGYLVETSLARTIGYRSNEEIGDACDTDFAIRLALANRSSHFVFVNRYTSQYRLLPFSARTAHNNCWKAYDEFQKIADLTPEQREARGLLLRKIAEQSVVDNAFHGRRKRALEIFFSSFYPSRRATVKATYHLGLIAFPGLLAFRDLIRGSS